MENKKVKITVYELMVKLENGLTTNEDIIELVGNYPLLSYMVLSGKDNEHLKDIMRVIPEVTCDIVESRLRRNFNPEAEAAEETVGETEEAATEQEPEVEEPKPGKVIRPAEAKNKPNVKETSKEERKLEEKPNKRVKKANDISVGTPYENMTVYEAYKECKKRKIEGVRPKKKKNDYVEILLENDLENEDWD